MRCARGFTLIEVLVAMVVLTVALLGMAQLVGEGVRQGAEATRLARTLEVIEHVAATGGSSGSLRGCEVSVWPDTAAIQWRWIEARCRRAESAAVALPGAPAHSAAAGDRVVTRLILVPS